MAWNKGIGLRVIAIIVCSVLMGTDARAGIDDELPPEAYMLALDRQIAESGVGVPGRPFPCMREEVHNGIEVLVGEPTEKCVKLEPQKRWSGLWRNDFEGSRFCPEPATECDYDTPGDRVWLTLRPDSAGDGVLYRVEFVGRKTMYRGPYGHFGLSDHEMIVDRMILQEEVRNDAAG